MPINVVCACGPLALALGLLAVLLIGCGGAAAALVYVYWDRKPAEEAADDDVIDAEEVTPPAALTPPAPEVFVPPGDNRPFLGHDSPVRAVAFTRDGRSLL